MTENDYSELKEKSLQELEELKGEGAKVDNLIRYINSLDYQEIRSSNLFGSELIPCGAFN